MAKYTERNNEILSAALSGEKLIDIGKRYGISAWRVSVICKRILMERELDQIAKQPENKDLIRYSSMSSRIRLALLHYGIDKISEAANMTDSELLRVPNFGKVSLKEFRDFLAQNGPA